MLALRAGLSRYLGLVLAPLLLVALPSSSVAQVTPPPTANGEPIEVRVSFFLRDVLRILDTEQAVEADLFFRLEWHDERLAKPGPEQRSMGLDEVWAPLFQPVAPRGLAELMPRAVLVFEDGRVTYTQRLLGKFGAPTNLQDFPFDEHEIRLEFAAPNLQRIKIDLAAGPVLGMSKDLTIADWTIADERLDLAPFTVIATLPPIPAASLVVHARRDSTHFMTKMILPLVIIVMLSWIVFWIPPAQIGTQFSFGSTSVLTVIAYRFALATQLPPVPYSTRLDSFVNGAFIMAALALVEVIVSARLLHAEKVVLAEKVDIACRWVFPLLLAGVAAGSFLA